MLHRTMLGLLLALSVAGCGQPAANPADTTQPEAAAPVEQSAPAAVPPVAENAPVEAPADAAPSTDGSAPSASGSTKTFVIVPGESTASYKVGEVFFREGNRFNLAIGSSADVNGSVQLDLQDPAKSVVGPITVDISKLKSDSDRRDGKIQTDWLESLKFPQATFTSTRLDNFPADAAEGKPINFQMTGDLTVREVTKPVTFDVTATLQADMLTGVATTKIQMTDFGFSPPEIGGMLKAEGTAELEIKLAAKPQ